MVLFSCLALEATGARKRLKRVVPSRGAPSLSSPAQAAVLQLLSPLEETMLEGLSTPTSTEKRTVVPCPGALLQSISPPIDSQRALQMASPSPVPLTERSGLLCTWFKCKVANTDINHNRLSKQNRVRVDYPVDKCGYELSFPYSPHLSSTRTFLAEDIVT